MPEITVPVIVEDLNLLVSGFQSLIEGNARVFDRWLDEAEIEHDDFERACSRIGKLLRRDFTIE